MADRQAVSRSEIAWSTPILTSHAQGFSSTSGRMSGTLFFSSGQ